MAVKLAVVVIGRNEEASIGRSLASVLEYAPALVYVDSASTDRSVTVARELGVEVVELPDAPPRTAARGRNAGRGFLRQRDPELEYVQFLDGDCEIEPGWTLLATELLQRHPDVGVVAGRLRERFRERNIYHRLADMEFDEETGDVAAVGGIAMYRTSAFDAAGGFDPAVATGEELELCARVLATGMRVVRLPDTMAYHDIDMDEFRQWWQRTKRCGFTAAQHYLDRRIMGRDVLSMLTWGGVLPVAAVAMSLPSFGLSLGLLTPYAVLWQRIRSARIRRGDSASDAALYATATVLGKVPEAAGVLSLARERLRSRIR